MRPPPLPLLAVAALLLLLLLSTPVRAELVVIVHKENPITQLDPAQVSNLYLGRQRTFPNGVVAQIYDLPRSCPLREKFFTRINGMSLSQINAYWARLMFSGRVLPPAALEDSQAMLRAVGNNIQAIGYVDEAVLDDSVREVLRLHE